MGLGYWKFMSLALEYHRFSTEVVRYHIHVTLNFLSAQTEELKKCGYELFLDFLFIISVTKQFSMGRIHENKHCQK